MDPFLLKHSPALSPVSGIPAQCRLPRGLMGEVGHTCQKEVSLSTGRGFQSRDS